MNRLLLTICLFVPALAVASPKDSEMSAEETYRSWLADREGGPVIEDRGLPMVGWRFFSTGDRANRAVVRSGVLLTLDSAAGWGPALAESSAADIAAVVVWLKGKATLSQASGPGPDADIQPPSIVTMPDGTRRFRAWFGEPPTFEPVMFTLTVPPSGEGRVHWGGGGEVQSMGSLEIQAILQDLSAKQQDERLIALESLNAIDDDAATQAIGLALADPSEDVRTRAIELLEEREGPVAVALLVGALPSESERLLRIEIINALDELGGDVASAAIRKAAAEDPDDHVRAVAASK